MHCHSSYPSDPSNLNLKVLNTLKKNKLRVGFSDHSTEKSTAAIAVALGAEIIEKHLTLNTKMSGPDHKASINPTQFKDMVNLIRLTEKMLGDGKKYLLKVNYKTNHSRKSLVAKKYKKR